MDLIENKYANSDINRHPWEIVRYHIISKQIAAILKTNDKKKIIIIDIGCGDAFVISKLTKQFEIHKAFAIDINFEDEIIKNLSQQNPKIEFLKNFDNLLIDNNYTYIILLNDVIEHIDQHNQFISRINKDIINKTQKSYLYITVPAFNFLFSNHDIDLGHFRRYRTKDLILYNNILNIKIVKAGYFFTLLFFVRFLIKIFTLKNNYKKDKIGVSSWDQNKFITKLVCLILIFDYYITLFFSKINIKLPGLSSFILFEK
jgi:hypothetical protein